MDAGNTAPEARALIEVGNLVKRYADKIVLDGLSLSISRGETCALIGGSGSGKSTFARLLMGLERPDAGEIWVDGVEIVGLGERARDRVRRKFAMVFQSHALLDSMSVFENVAFPIREGTGYGAAEIAERVHAALRELDVDDAAGKLPGQLSGGMAKRVGIARAIIVEPEILVYDEPTSGLDPISSRVVDALIERMRTSHGVTSVVITHDMVTAYDVADRIVLLAGGKAVASGTPEELFRSTAGGFESFARSSGIDLARLGPRTERVPAADLRARWDQAHPPRRAPPPRRSWAWLRAALPTSLR
jgi:phospholipid/cholesterol/gamma-HCH transport system ATP-binding protein